MAIISLEERVEIMNDNLIESRVESRRRVFSPSEARRRVPISDVARRNILLFRSNINDNLKGVDKRLIVIAGPCSIHNYKSAIELGKELKEVSDEYPGVFFVYRGYVDKPRSKGGCWEGFINDPDLDGSCNREKGILETRRLFLELAELGIPVATEFLEIEDHKYIGDLVSWAAIGARSSEYQPLIKRMSGLSIPVGFKNNTAGKIETAVNACSKASKPNCYCDFCENGLERVQTLGNPNSHVILRGGNGPNYDSESIGKAVDLSKVEGLEPAVIVDCSHGNSGKDPEKQPIVFESVVDQRVNNVSLKGVMVEVNKKGGKQSFEYGISCAASLDPYLSITDAGLSLEGYSQMLSKCLRG